MAAIVSQSARLSSTTTTNTTTTTQKPPQIPPPSKTHLPIPSHKPLLNYTNCHYCRHYNTNHHYAFPRRPTNLPNLLRHCSSAANYGGYGGNSNKKASAEYIYNVPDGWKERQVSKVEKGTNGTDSEFYNPKKRTEKEYLTFLSGFRQLAPRDVVLNNLALSDVDLQDLIAGAESVKSEEKKDEDGQLYYVYEIDGIGKHSLIKVTFAKNKLYAHFVNAPTPEWNRDEETLRHLHESFKTVG